ncbi:2-hydroxyacid dehydrogenase [Acidobacterium sp. S8]|uniref:2-hydroxyacid dehydrogenase n=1 Tax=Acidobacterium sp. S8 TaxID=1641854 RepID=UPI00131DB37D|nr:2-hydroxyacid dehydrogenase [Acidobacterium sp. S8]
MIRVGVPYWADAPLIAKLPKEADVIVLPKAPAVPIEIDFWVTPIFAKDAQPVAPFLRGVKVVQSLQAGVDWQRNFVPPGAILCDAQGVHNVATSEWTVSAILAMTKFLPFYFDLQRAGKWVSRDVADENYRSIYKTQTHNYPPVLIEELEGKTVMIVGYGSIGKSIEERLVPFGVNIVRVARSAKPGVEPVSRLRELLYTADIIVLIVPLTPETHHLIDADAIACMKQGALLVNAARGPVVDTDALVEALTDKRIRAALDVTDPEPLPEGHPLWTAPNLLLTPHVGGSSPLFMPRAFDLVAQQIRRFMHGESLKNVVHGDY